MKKILVVDDDPDVRESLDIMLSDNYAVVTAADGKEALEKLDQEPFNAIVLDLMMPNIDGEGVLRGMSARSIATPVVIISAVHDLKGRAERLGQRYLRKPYDMEELEKIIEEMVQSSP